MMFTNLRGGFQMLTIRKIFALIVILVVICCGLSGISYAQTFSDIQGNWAQTQIEKWAGKRLVIGYPDGTFRPDNRVTRAEFVTMVNRAFIPNKTESSSNYKDVSMTQWYYHEVAIAKQQGYITGYPDGGFQPNNYITNQEVAVILARLFAADPKNLKDLNFTDKNQIQSWAYTAVQKVTTYQLMNGYKDGTFQPNHEISRAETLVALDNAFLLLNSAQPSTSTNPLTLPIQTPLPLPVQLPNPGQ